jgi:hypothetical protein
MPMESEEHLERKKAKRRKDIVCCGISEFSSFDFCARMNTESKHCQLYTLLQKEHN